MGAGEGREGEESKHSRLNMQEVKSVGHVSQPKTQEGRNVDFQVFNSVYY